MNTRTTLFLAFAVVVLGLVYYIVETRPAPASTDTSTATAVTSTTSRKLIETELGDIVKVAVKKKGAEAEWVFEKESGEGASGVDVWKMRSPSEMACVRWEIERFGSDLKNLQYEIAYRPGEPGAVTAEQAGLATPEAVITLTDEQGRTASVEIGRPASEQETYVRLAGDSRVVVGKSNLKSLLKDRAIDYREKQLWTLPADKVTRVDIESRAGEGESASYAFIREGGAWRIASPVTARATGKVDEMLTAIARLRVVDWTDDRADRLAAFGLQPAATTLRVTVEETVEKTAEAEEDSADEQSEGEAAAAAEPTTEIKTTVHTLHFSGQSPIGEETKVYVRVGEENAVGTVMKTVADKCRPVLDQWRDMHITSADVMAATRVELTGSVGDAVLMKDGGGWAFENGDRAESAAVEELLSAVRDLSAVTFLTESETAGGSFGFDHAQADIRLTIPGAEGTERIVVGAYSDATTRRLVFVGRGDLKIVAKARADAVEKLTRDVLAYRDRSIVELVSDRLKKLTFTRRMPGGEGTEEFALAPVEGSWRMVAPVEAEANEAEIAKLLSSLSALRAMRVVGDGGTASDHGLGEPAVSLHITYAAVGEAGGEGEGAPSDGIEDEAPHERAFRLLLAEHGGRFFAMRDDRAVVYELAAAAFPVFRAEFRADRVLAFEQTDVTRLTVRNGDVTHTFVRQEGGWIYEAEPDLPLDSAKVDNLLLQIRDLRAQRYVAHQADVSAPEERFGLDTPAHEVQIGLKGGETLHLKVSGRNATGVGVVGPYAGVVGKPGVFILPADTPGRLTVTLGSLEATP